MPAGALDATTNVAMRGGKIGREDEFVSHAAKEHADHESDGIVEKGDNVVAHRIQRGDGG